MVDAAAAVVLGATVALSFTVNGSTCKEKSSSSNQFDISIISAIGGENIWNKDISLIAISISTRKWYRIVYLIENQFWLEKNNRQYPSLLFLIYVFNASIDSFFSL